MCIRDSAIEESPPRATVHVYEGSTGATLWTRLLPGTVTRDDAGVAGAASLSPDARRVAVGTQQGDVEVFDAANGERLWSYRAAGASLVAFAEDDPHRLGVAGRIVANRPYDSLMVFSVGAEPLGQRAAVVASGLVALAASSVALILGIGFWRARGPY